MAAKDKKTEHSGPKKGNGSYWGRKKQAKDVSNKARREQDKRESSNKKETTDESHELDTNAVLDEAFMDEMYPPKEETHPVNIGYDVYNIFQRYWRGQGDPLYAILSRRGNGTSPAWVDASNEEVDALFDTAEKALRSKDRTEERVAHEFIKRNRDLKTNLWMNDIPNYMESAVDPLNTSMVIEDAFEEDSWSKRAGKNPGLRGVGYDFDHDPDGKTFKVSSPKNVLMQLLDEVYDPADVTDDELKPIARAFYDEYAGEMKTIGDLRHFVRTFTKTEGGNMHHEAAGAGGGQLALDRMVDHLAGYMQSMHSKYSSEFGEEDFPRILKDFGSILTDWDGIKWNRDSMRSKFPDELVLSLDDRDKEILVRKALDKYTKQRPMYDETLELDTTAVLEDALIEV